MDFLQKLYLYEDSEGHSNIFKDLFCKNRLVI